MSNTDESPKAAWDGNSPQVAAARGRLVEAACRCIARDGLAATSMAAVAAEAGVSRQTVYRYFAGRDDLARQAIFSRAGALAKDIAARTSRLADPADIIVEALVIGLAAIRADAVLQAMWDSSSPDGLVAQMFTERGGITWTRDVLGRAVELAGWSSADANLATEFFLRIALSLLISPEPERGDEELRTFLYRYLIPGLGLATSEEIEKAGEGA